MKKILTLLLAVLMIVTLTGCSTTKQETETASDEQFDTLMKQWFVEDMEDDYLSAHYSVADFEAMGITDYEVTLGEVSSEDEENDNELQDRITTLQNYDTSNLNDTQLLTYNALVAYYELMEEFSNLNYDYGFCFTPSSGVNNNLITNFTEFVVRDEQDIIDLITLINDSDRYIQECIDYTLDQAEQGIVQSDSTIDEIIEQCQRFIEKVDDNEVIVSAQTSLVALNLSNEADYQQQIQDAVKNVLIPAYQKIIDMYQGLKGKCTNELGLCYYADGAAYYEALFKLESSVYDTDVSTMAVNLKNAIDDTVEDIITLSSSMSVKEYNKYWDDNSYYGYSDPNEILEYIKSNMSEDFPEIPDVSYTVNYLDPSVTSEGTVAYYLLCPVDDVSENVIKVNESYTTDDPDYLCLTLAHEGYPGHCYQTTYYYANHPTDYMRAQLSNLGTTEGWAMYVMEYAAYYFTTEDLAEMENLYTRLSYYLPAYIDIMVNYKGWNKKQISNYLSSFYQSADEIADSYLDLVTSDPGLYLSYGVGLYEMVTMKEEAVEALGDKFDVKEYNTVLLEAAMVNFDLMHQQVENYIASK